jgi:hypothetical protein
MENGPIRGGNARKSLKPIASKVLADIGTRDHAPVVVTFES